MVFQQQATVVDGRAAWLRCRRGLELCCILYSGMAAIELTRQWAAREKAIRVIEKLHGLRLARAAELVEAAVEETLAYYGFPEEHWRWVCTNNPLERILREIRRRTRVVHRPQSRIEFYLILRPIARGPRYAVVFVSRPPGYAMVHFSLRMSARPNCFQIVCA